MDNPYENNSKKRFWSTAVKEKLENFQNLEVPSLSDYFTKYDNICTAGSCFAQHIGNLLRERNYKFKKSRYNHSSTSFGVGNIYTTRQLLQWLEFSVGSREWSESTVFKSECSHYYDYLLPRCEPKSKIEEIFDRRVDIANEMIANICTSDFFIFTLGLTEQWQTKSEEVLPSCPGTIIGVFNPEQHLFNNLTFSSIINDLKEIESHISKLNSRIKLIYTVSPVPLTATAENEHVIIANGASKAKLRAAIEQHLRTSKRSKYFPSFELITHNTMEDWRFEKNLRNVSKRGIDFVMKHSIKGRSERDILDKNKLNDFDVFCDEQKLESFNRNNSQQAYASNIFLIGDSQMNCLGKAFSRKKIQYNGGQILNASEFSFNKFALDKYEILKLDNNYEAQNIWSKTFKKLRNLSNNNTLIITNIGFQSYHNLVQAINKYQTAYLDVDDITNFYEKEKKTTLELLARLSEYGSILMLEDPNFYGFVNNSKEAKLISYCYAQQIEFLRGLATARGYTYKSYCQTILRDVDKETGQIQYAMHDTLHGSDIYYDRLTSFLKKDLNLSINKKLQKLPN